MAIGCLRVSEQRLPTNGVASSVFESQLVSVLAFNADVDVRFAGNWSSMMLLLNSHYNNAYWFCFNLAC